MTTPEERFSEAARIFEACRTRSVRERLALMREMCGSDEPLRLEVEELLEAHDREGDPLRTGAGSGAGVVHEVRSPDPDRIGRYTVLGRLGAGGMGVVYRASQDAPKREVALKVLPASLRTDAMRARFDAEAQALGRLDHPHIARIFEAGVEHAEGGAERPYFAMELVKGKPLNEAAASRPLRERLELMARVCDAVQHAHQRGVIHRDLKPSNILVDASGEPRVLDFGIARLIGSDLEHDAAHTLTGHVLGTAQYMSPEQASGDPASVDTRADVYALGVLLYECVTGELPYDVRGVPLIRALRIIGESRPKPLPDLRSRHQSDLATIVLKALSKEPELRYQTASALSEDLRRTLRNEPILAHPPSTVYQIQKFIIRNKPAVALGVLACAALVIGAVALAVGFNRASASEAVALARLEEAQRETRKAEAVRDFLQGMLGSVEPSEMNDREFTVRQALDAAREELAGSAMIDEPEVRGAVLFTLGHTYRGLGLPDEAESALIEAVDTLRGTDDRYELALARNALAGVMLDRRRFSEAESHYQESLNLLELLPERAALIPVTLDGMGLAVQGLGDTSRALEIFESALPLHEASYGKSSLEYATCLNNVAFARYYLGEFEQAARGFEDVLAIQRERVEEGHPDVMRTIANLGATYERTGKLDKALAMHERSLALRMERLGPDHPDLFYGHLGVGNAKRRFGDFEGSLAHFEDAVRVIESAYGSMHANAAAAWFAKAQSLRSLKRYDEAWRSFRQAADIRDANGLYKLAAEAFDSAAYVRQHQKDYDAALAELETLIAYQMEHLPDDTQFAGTVQLSYGLLFLRMEQYESAAGALAHSVTLRKQAYGESHGRVGEAMCRLGAALYELGRDEEAIDTLRDAERMIAEEIGPTHWLLGETRETLGMCMLRSGDPAAGAELLEFSYGVLETSGVSQERLGEIARALVRAYTALENADAAARWQEAGEMLTGS